MTTAAEAKRGPHLPCASVKSDGLGGGKSQSSNWRKGLLVISARTVRALPCEPKARARQPRRGAPVFVIFEVLSRKSVSWGDILWNTTFWMDVLPLLRAAMSSRTAGAAAWRPRTSACP